MSRLWPVQDAKSRFSQLVATAIAEGPQIVTKRGAETVVVVPIAHWRLLEASPPRRTIKEILLAPEARTDNLAAPRLRFTPRPPPDFD